MFGADENCRRGFDDPHQAAESCTMVEFMHSFEMLLKITGDPLWADRAEEVAFNSYPCSQSPDLKALHYLTAPNQVVLDARNHSPGVQNRGCMFAYNPHSYRCCQHNVSHGWPYYAEERRERGEGKGRRRDGGQGHGDDRLPVRGQHHADGARAEGRALPALSSYPTLVQPSEARDQRQGGRGEGRAAGLPRGRADVAGRRQGGAGPADGAPLPRVGEAACGRRTTTP